MFATAVQLKFIHDDKFGVDEGCTTSPMTYKDSREACARPVELDRVCSRLYLYLHLTKRVVL